jgi:hypothetical protein
VSSSASSDGQYALRSGAITHNQKSQIEITLNSACDTVTFDLKVSTENNYDVFRVYVDGAGKSASAGELDWQPITLAVAPGVHKLSFQYLKNGSISNGSDAVWIDKLSYCDGADRDGDGISNSMDNDSDNDGVIDSLDQDDDGDGIPDSIDADPLNGAINTERNLPVDSGYKGSAIKDAVERQ